VSDIPIIEKLLLNAEGWQAMKPARELLKTGRVQVCRSREPTVQESAVAAPSAYT